MSKTATPQDFAALAAQYWQAFSDFGRQTGASDGSLPGWAGAMGEWERLARSMGAGVKPTPATGPADLEAVLERFSQQAGQWLGMMQGLAAQFAGKQADATEVAKAWQRMLEGAGLGPFNAMFQGMPGSLPGMEALDLSGLMANLRGEASSLLGLPAFGYAREHQERWQRMAQAQLDVQPALAGYQAQIGRANQRAFEIFERKLAERSEPGRQIDSVRGLFDLWIDAAEEAWAEVAFSREFQQAYVALVNALMALRAAQQAELAQVARAVGLPSREDVAAGDRRVHALETELRALRARLAALEAGTGGADGGGAPTTGPAGPKSRAKAKPRASGAKSAPARAGNGKQAKGNGKSAKAASPRRASAFSVTPPTVAAPRRKSAKPATRRGKGA